MTKPKAGEAKSVSVRTVSVRGAETKAPRKKPASSTPKTLRATKKTASAPKPALPKKRSTAEKAHKKPTDVLGKKIIVESSDTVAEKIKIVERISKKRTQPELVYTRTGTPSFDEFKANIQLALATTFRMPEGHAHVASSFARVAGFAFVFLGAFFALYNMHASSILTLGGSRDLLAQTAGTTCTSDTNCTSSTTTTTSPSSGGTSGSTVDPQPGADISVDSSASLLVGTVTVNVTVPYATRVDLVAVNKETQTTHTITTLTRKTDLLWSGAWDTKAFPDGTYRLRANITNQMGSYWADESTDYAVLNYPINTTTNTEPLPSPGTGSTSGIPTTTTGTASSTTSQTTTATTTNTASLPSLRVEPSMAEPFKGAVEFRTFTLGATAIYHYIKQSSAATFTKLGNAYLQDVIKGEWRYRINTADLPNGDYDVKTQAIYANGLSNEVVLRELTIRNLTTTATTTNTATSSTAGASSTPASVATSTAPVSQMISFEFTKQNPMNGTVDVYMRSSDAKYIELSAIPKGTLTPRFLGTPSLQSDGVWRYRFDTTLLPNGLYGFVAKVRSIYGETTSEPVSISIYNTIKAEEPDPETAEYLGMLKEVGDQSKEITGENAVPPPAPVSVEGTSEDVAKRANTSALSIKETEIEVLKEELGDGYDESISALIDDFYTNVGSIMREFGRAVRVSDEAKQRALLEELETLRKGVVAKLPTDDNKKELVAKIENHIETTIKNLRERTEKSEALIKERVGDAVVKDTDTDGITDYDEINLYGTDPLSADTDRDGFVDGIEIERGFDPLSSARESNLVYESPKEQGVVREDILEVSQINTILDGGDEQPTVKAHISGRALPNSFVTLYVFSTPVVITVKTDKNGNWSYIFDKELDNGSHEVYVGITDNTGKIVAKSEPLPFVKTAEAYTPGDAAGATAAAEQAEPSLISERALLVIGSLIIVALGLVLIMLGLHVRPREEVPLLV